MKWQKKEPSTLEDRSVEIIQSEEQKEEWKKWTESQKPEGKHKAHECMHNRNHRMRGESEMDKNNIWRNNGQKFQTARKNDLYIQEACQIPSKINSDIRT